MNEFELSIIIPTFNSEKIIELFLSKLKKITEHISTEIIIVDDGSTDDTYKVLNSIKSRYNAIRVVHQKNMKQAAARNNGLKLATGKYIMFLDDDDDYRPDFISKLMLTMRQDGCRLAMCGIEKKIGMDSKIEIHSKLSKVKNNEELVEVYLTHNLELDVGLWNKIFIRDIITKYDIRFSNGNFFEDSLFVLEYLNKINSDEVRIVEEPLYILNKNIGSSTTTSFNPAIDELANKYDQKVKKVIGNYLYGKVSKAFKARTYMHCVHHHISYDVNWNGKKQVSFLKENEVNVKNVFSDLPPKYKLALLQMILLPNLYTFLYKKKKNY